MKKFIKWFILLVVLFIGIFSYTKADLISCVPYFVGGNDLTDTPGSVGLRSTLTNNTMFCLNTNSQGVSYSLDNTNRTSMVQYSAVCFDKQTYSNYSTIYWQGGGTRKSIFWVRFKGDCFKLTSQQCQTEYNLIPISSVDQNYCTSNNLCPATDSMTSLECQTEYNLIPINEVTSNYCKLNFDLISPLDCPSGGGSGSGDTVVFSNVYVNNVLYPGGADIYLNVNELLATDISYNTGLMYIDIDYSGDSDYIDSVVNINSYRPTSEDFTNIFVGGLVRLFPFVVIALFIAFVRKLIRKIFK